MAVTARDLGLAESQLYAWRKQASDASSVTEDERLHQAEFTKLKRDKARLEEEVAFQKKRRRTLLSCPSELRHNSLLNEFCLIFMCRILRVSRSGYYQWRRRKQSKRAKENAILDVKI